MTLRGKRKALNNSPEAQIAAIAEAFGGKVPVKPLPRRFPGAVWQEGDTFHIAKLTRGELHYLTSKGNPHTGSIFRNALSACGYLAKTYYRKISLPDLQAATAGPVPVPTLAEAQRAIICWTQDRERTRYSTVATWQYCIVTPKGIKSGTTQEKPKPMEGYPGSLIVVFSAEACKDLLRRAFQLDIRGGELKRAFNKVVAIPKIIAVKEYNKNTGAVASVGNGNLRNREKENVSKQNTISS
ncbi:hypothetical protein ACFLVO_04220 [Chloroflexota bacterium]